MVTFNNAGRFGNWYMECCTAIAYALKHDLEFTVPSHTNHPYHNPIYCLHLVNQNYNPNLEKVHLWEGKHSYEELPFDESYRNKNIIVEGYRQSEKYFRDFRSELLYLLDFPYEKKEGYVAIHQRHGDYRTLRMKHPELPISYFEKAMAMFPNYKFKVFSDDIPLCREEFKHLDVEYSTNTDEVADFIEMQNCEHFINSSSTYSWAASWHSRSENKVIVTPKLWFVEGWMNMDVSDIIPDTWIKI